MSLPYIATIIGLIGAAAGAALAYLAQRIAQKSVTNFGKMINRNIQENEDFLRSKAKETYAEVVGLVNDAIDHIIFFVEEKMVEDYGKFAVIHYVHQILMPLSYAMVIDLLTTNLVACFMELRLMVESLVKCYFADLKYPEQPSFRKKIELLDEERKQRKTITKLMEEYGEDAKELWKQLSEEWIHTKGIVNRIVKEITNKSELPAWPVVLPITYADTELDVLEELRRNVSKFRRLLNAVIEDWKKSLINQI
ncbi:MAG: hypothetical protein ACTSV0_11570 [Candidatus Freyarchaeota archaeon]